MGLHDLSQEKLPVSEKDLRAAYSASLIFYRAVSNGGAKVRIYPANPIETRIRYKYNHEWYTLSATDYEYCANFIDGVGHYKNVAVEKPEIIYD